MPLKIVPKLTKRTPKRTILRQDGAQDRQEDPKGTIFAQDCAQDRKKESKGEHFGAKMVSKIAKRSPKGSILEPRWCPRSWAKLSKAKVTKSVRVLLKTRI